VAYTNAYIAFSLFILPNLYRNITFIVVDRA